MGNLTLNQSGFLALGSTIFPEELNNGNSCIERAS
jgi:hypothetical protein